MGFTTFLIFKNGFRNEWSVSGLHGSLEEHLMTDVFRYIRN